MKILKNNINFSVMLSLAITPLLQAYSPHFTDHVTNRYLESFPAITTPKQEIAAPKLLNEQSYKEHWQTIIGARDLQLQKLTAREIAELEFKKTKITAEPDDIIDTHFIDKMELVKNLNNANTQDHLLSRLVKHESSNLQTIMGHKRLVEMLSQPVIDRTLLEKRQTIIKELVTNDTLRNECSQLLKKIARAEPLFYDVHTHKELTDFEKSFYFGPLLNKLGANNPIPLAITTRAGQIFTIGIFVGTAVASVACPIMFAHPKLRPWLLSQNINFIKTAVLLSAFGIPFSVVLLSGTKQYLNIFLNMQERLIGFNTYIANSKKLMQRVQANETIRERIPHLKTILNELTHSHTKSADFNYLNRLLTASAFNEGNPSSFSSVGKILMAYKQVTQEAVRFEYTDTKNLLGELDAYVALAETIKAHQQRNGKFCFVEFQYDSSGPLITAHNFWNPFISSDKVVCNTISLNTGNERNIILTGPNTGGKSTIMKGLMINALLAQTFGIAAAERMTITPFAKLLSYLGISDDTATGISLFKAEVKRAQELMTALRSLKENEFAFIIIDEIFNGTSPEKTEELSYKFMQQLTEFKNCLFIDATHFKKLAALEQETNGICKNYHTGVILDPQDPTKVAQYTYTLTPGPSPINNAQQVAQEGGIQF